MLLATRADVPGSRLLITRQGLANAGHGQRAMTLAHPKAVLLQVLDSYALQSLKKIEGHLNICELLLNSR